MNFFSTQSSYSLRIGIVTLLLLFTGFCTLSFAQSGNCHPTTPFFNVDLSANPNSSWTSPTTTRVEHCCGVTGTARCIEFLVTLAPSAVVINFDVASGANPPGWFYQVNCGAQIPMGTPICINGPGPYTITFCKPGGNPNTYRVTSIGGPTGSPDKTIGNGCNTTMSISGVVNPITWTSIFPGAIGAYNSYLSCTSNCASTTVTAQTGHPPYVDYRVCGATVAVPPCVPAGTFCDTVRVYMSTPVVNTINPNPASFCANNPSVLLTGTVNGGVPPYTYAWTNGANGTGTVVGTGLTYNATITGTYSFIVYDQNYPACPAPITNVTVTSSPVPTINAGVNQTICGTVLTLNGTVTGATGGIWSGGSGTFAPGNTSLNATYTPTNTELTAGTVILTLTSTGNGACSPVSDQVVLFISSPIIATITSPSVICFGQTATITANVSGGIAPYTYLWNTGATTQSISNVLPGTHSVTVTGGSPGFCTAIASVTLATNPQIIVTTSPNNTIVCSSTATISASATGGTGTLSYLWSNGATTPSTNVNTGTYIITVTDATGCSAINSVSVTASSSLTATVNQPAVLCNGAVATLIVTVTGGLGGNSFLWNTGATTATISVGAGTYCATVTDAGGCITATCVTVTQNLPLTVSIPTPSIICNGSSTTVNASASGGQAPYTFLWNTGQTSQSLVAPAGTYTVTVTDFTGCVGTASVTISQASVINIATSSVGVGCFGGNNGSATASVTGGVSTYFYSWSPYGGSSATATGLLAGTYTVTVTDAIGCTLPATVFVSAPLALAATITVQNQVSCNGGNNGAAIVNPTGGTPAYSYSWNPSGGTLQNPSNLSAGSYTVTVTDSNGCVKIVQTNITQPTAPLTVSLISSDVSCNGGSTGSATVLATGGSPGYTYSWAPSGGTNATANNLAVGTYTVTSTDLNGCTTPLTIVINQSPPLTSIISNSSNVTCNGGSNGTATVTPSGGTAPYTFAWNTSPVQTTAVATNLSAGTYSVIVTDFKNCITTSSSVTITAPPALIATASPSSLISCNSSITISSAAIGGSGAYTYLWNTGATSSGINVNTGNYVITITDAVGCSASDSVSVLASNSTLTAAINQPPNICFGTTTTITVNVTGGLGGNSYLWSTNAITPSITAGAGSYCVTVTDIGGCVTTACASINQNPQISVTIATPPNICPGGTATITAVGSGGQPAYAYLWSSLETTQSIVKSAGTYTVTLSDITGSLCSASASVTITEAPPINAAMSFTNVSCFGLTNGTALVYASGGTPGYNYSWAPSGGTNASATLLGQGSYTVTVTDLIGCIKTGNVTITQPGTAVSITLVTTNNLCSGDSIGIATATGHGGTSPYYYYWTPGGDTIAAITGLKAGVYDVVVADSTGCYTDSLISISQPTDIVLSGTTVASTCSYNNGSATVTASGGTGAFTYTWTTNPVQTTATATNILAGNYTVTVTDSNNCHRSLPLTVVAATSLDANFNATTECLNTPTSFTDSSTSSSGNTITSWAWDFGNFIDNSQNPTYTYTSPGIYTVSLTVTSSLGCVSTVTKPVSFYYLPTANFLVINACTNALAQFTDSSTVPVDSISSWLWNFGDSSPASTTQNTGHTYDSAAVYNVSLIVTSNHGCIDTIVKPLTVYPLPVVQFTANDTSGCAPLCSQFTDTSIPPNDTITSWSWNFGDGSASGSNLSMEHCYNVMGTYTVSLTATTSHGCSATKTKLNLINVYPLPVAAFNYSPQPANTDVPEIYFNNLSLGSSAWLWNFGDVNDPAVSTVKFPTHRYSDSGRYCTMLIVQNTHSCFDTVVHCLEINAEFTFYIPNAFTPGGDGINDGFSGFGTFISQYDMWIFDRWGNMIFHTDELRRAWDGRANNGTEVAQIDVYVYLVELKDFKGNKHTYRGTVTLVR